MAQTPKKPSQPAPQGPLTRRARSRHQRRTSQRCRLTQDLGGRQVWLQTSYNPILDANGRRNESDAAEL